MKQENAQHKIGAEFDSLQRIDYGLYELDSDSAPSNVHTSEDSDDLDPTIFTPLLDETNCEKFQDWFDELDLKQRRRLLTFYYLGTFNTVVTNTVLRRAKHDQCSFTNALECDSGIDLCFIKSKEKLEAFIRECRYENYRPTRMQDYKNFFNRKRKELFPTMIGVMLQPDLILKVGALIQTELNEREEPIQTIIPAEQKKVPNTAWLEWAKRRSQRVEQGLPADDAKDLEPKKELYKRTKDLHKSYVQRKTGLFAYMNSQFSVVVTEATRQRLMTCGQYIRFVISFMYDAFSLEQLEFLHKYPLYNVLWNMELMTQDDAQFYDGPWEDKWEMLTEEKKEAARLLAQLHIKQNNGIDLTQLKEDEDCSQDDERNCNVYLRELAEDLYLPDAASQEAIKVLNSDSASQEAGEVLNSNAAHKLNPNISASAAQEVGQTDIQFDIVGFDDSEIILSEPSYDEELRPPVENAYPSLKEYNRILAKMADAETLGDTKPDKDEQEFGDEAGQKQDENFDRIQAPYTRAGMVKIQGPEDIVFDDEMERVRRKEVLARSLQRTKDFNLMDKSRHEISAAITTLVVRHHASQNSRYPLRRPRDQLVNVVAMSQVTDEESISQRAVREKQFFADRKAKKKQNKLELEQINADRRSMNLNDLKRVPTAANAKGQKPTKHKARGTMDEVKELWDELERRNAIKQKSNDHDQPDLRLASIIDERAALELQAQQINNFILDHLSYGDSLQLKAHALTSESKNQNLPADQNNPIHDITLQDNDNNIEMYEAHWNQEINQPSRNDSQYQSEPIEQDESRDYYLELLMRFFQNQGLTKDEQAAVNKRNEELGSNYTRKLERIMSVLKSTLQRQECIDVDSFQKQVTDNYNRFKIKHEQRESSRETSVQPLFHRGTQLQPAIRKVYESQATDLSVSGMMVPTQQLPLRYKQRKLQDSTAHDFDEFSMVDANPPNDNGPTESRRMMTRNQKKKQSK